MVSEITGRPYLADNFRAVFAKIRRAAGLSGVQFLDLRRTAVVRLAEAGCTAGFTHEPSGSLSESRVGRSPIEAIGDEWHDRRFGGVLHGA